MFNTFQPILEPLKSRFLKINIHKKIDDKATHFSTTILPQAINTIAVQSIKTCIKGYKLIQCDVRYVKNYIKSQNFYKYFKQAAEEANRQLSTSEPNNSFRNSLRVDPKDLLSKKTINFPNNFNNVIDLYK